MGQSRIMQPWRKGSVFEAFMLMRAIDVMTVMSLYRSVVVGSNLCADGDRYSDERRKPKNAVVQAVHSICRSKVQYSELSKYL